MKLIVVMAFDADEEGELLPVYEQEAQNTHQAISKAKLLAQDHAGAIAWEREADPDHGEYGPPEVLFQAGEIPDMD